VPSGGRRVFGRRDRENVHAGTVGRVERSENRVGHLGRADEKEA
jgi:hypothetical protein